MLVEFCFAVHQLFFTPSIFRRKLIARHNIPCDDVTKFKLTVPAQPIKASKVFQCSMFAGLWSVWKVQLVDWPESTLTGRTWQKWRLYRPTKVLPSIWGQSQWWPGNFNLFLCHMSIPQTNHVLRQNRWVPSFIKRKTIRTDGKGESWLGVIRGCKIFQIWTHKGKVQEV